MDQAFSRFYATQEDVHWWFTARRVILRGLLAQAVPWREGMEVLEVGVGAGANLHALYPPGMRVWGLEPDPDNAELARRRGAVPVVTGSIEALPDPLDRMHFDVIGLFDVLEHIADDRQALAAIRARLRPGGHLLLAVPAYQWMWGRQDVVSHHFRRYTRAGLTVLLLEAGFTVHRATYFNTILFPGIALVRLLARALPVSREAPRSDFERFRPGALNSLLHRVFAFEARWLNRFNLPFGVSLFVSATPTGPSTPLERGTRLAPQDPPGEPHARSSNPG